MPTYSCRSYQLPYQQIRVATLSAKEFKESSYERTSLTAFIKNSNLTCQSVAVFTQGLNFPIETPYVFLNLYVLGFKFESSLLKQKPGIATRQFKLADQLYWHLNYYSVHNAFNYSVNPESIKLFNNYGLKGISQDKSHLILDKNILEEFGLTPVDNNSLEELLYFLLLFFEKELQSGRIKVVSCGYSKIKEKSQWLEVHFFLINLSVDTFHKPFPSPQLFSI